MWFKAVEEAKCLNTNSYQAVPGSAGEKPPWAAGSKPSHPSWGHYPEIREPVLQIIGLKQVLSK